MSSDHDNGPSSTADIAGRERHPEEEREREQEWQRSGGMGATRARPDRPRGEEPDHERRETDRGSRAGTATEAGLLPPELAGQFRTRWEESQRNFVDDPRRSVEEVDSLVAETMKALARRFSEERDRLEEQWKRGEQVSTEDLRQALQRYRWFFQRLLAV
jgi:hypothetical protein